MSKKVKGQTTPIGLVRYATEYLEAACVVDNTIGQRPGYELISPVSAYYLLCHSLELGLKAFLLKKGISLSRLSGKDLGHKLGALFAEAQKLNLNEIFELSSLDKETLNLLIGISRDNQLRYMQTGLKIFPSWGAAYPFVCRFHEAVCSFLEYESTELLALPQTLKD